MTIAICYACGEQKLGALTTCPCCGATPLEPHTAAMSMCLTDHHYRPADLIGVGKRVANGESIPFGEEFLGYFELYSDCPELLTTEDDEEFAALLDRHTQGFDSSTATQTKPRRPWWRIW